MCIAIGTNISGASGTSMIAPSCTNAASSAYFWNIV